MKNKRPGLSFLLIATLAFCACKKQLNVYPTTSEVDGNLITDQASAQTLLNGVYYKFFNEGTTYGSPATKWLTLHEVYPSQLAGSLTDIFDSDHELANLTPGGSYTNPIWDYDYALVNAANDFIKNATPAQNIPAAVRQQMLAEARFLKAFGNAELLLYYAQYYDPSSKYGIILRDVAATAATVNQQRSGVAAAYTSILSDLDAAIQGLPSKNTAIYLANSWAAKLLKARVLINRGTNDDYAQVAALTNDIIMNGPFQLEDSLKDIFLTKSFSSKEIIMGIQPYPNETTKYNVYISQPVTYASDSLVSWLKGDARSQWMTKYVFTRYLGTSIHLQTKYYSGDPIHPALTPPSVNSYAFRLTEAYLLEAEALSHSDPAQSKALLTTVMSHAGAGPEEFNTVANATTPQALQLEIAKETIRNFFCENGADWFALRRLPFATLHTLNPNFKDPNHLIFPIPKSQTEANNAIQNPGY